MRIVQVLLALAGCAVLLLSAYYAEPVTPDWQPNPLKSSPAQYSAAATQDEQADTRIK